MITFFTTAKPFRGHDGIIQRNALTSWKLLHPEVQVVLFGNDEGAAEVCRDLGLVHEPYVDRHESGTKRLNYMFARVQEISDRSYFCFANCDIVLTTDFWRAFEKLRRWREKFLLVAQRWDTDVTELIDPGNPEWASTLRTIALSRGRQQDEYWIDIFLFGRGQYLDMPPLLVGHCYWDNWMIWKALQDGVPVVDGTPCIMPIHQNHGYSLASGRVKGVPSDPMSQVNLALIGGLAHTEHIKSSTHRLSRNRWIYWNSRPARLEAKRIALFRVWLPIWHGVLDVTRPLRKLLGLRSSKAQ